MTDILQKIHKKKSLRHFFFKPPMYQELMLPNIKKISGANVYNQHGIYEQIPIEHKEKPIVSCIRNPFDHYVSLYEYRNWRNQQSHQLEKIKKIFPLFPELTFEQYLSFIDTFEFEDRTYSDLLKLDIGILTFSFIQFFFKDHKKIIENLDEAYLNSNRYKEDMADILFLHTENVNHELHDFLLRLHYRKKDLYFINAAERKNVTADRKEKNWKKYYTKDLFDFVKFKERFILRLFPEYDKEYDGVFR